MKIFNNDLYPNLVTYSDDKLESPYEMPRNSKKHLGIEKIYIVIRLFTRTLNTFHYITILSLMPFNFNSSQ